MTRLLYCALVFCTFFATQAAAQVNVLTANYGNERSNSNLNETALSASNVAPGDFIKLGSFPVDGQIFAQPLYASKIAVPNRGIFNIVYVATQHNSVYAYDADSVGAPSLLWQVNFGPSVPSSTFGSDYKDISPEIGILSTPAIDLERGAIYVTAATFEKGAVVYRLHALDLTSGTEKFNGPAVIKGSVKGTGVGNANNKVAFDPMWHIQRPGLLLANGNVYLAFGSHGDAGPWHGWMASYSASDLTKQTALFMASPNGWGGSIWQSGYGLAADNAGSVYAISGNGSYDGITEFSESLLKFKSTLSLEGWATPPNWSMLADNDYDLSAGPALIPGTHSVVMADKYGQLYYIDGDALAAFTSGQSGNAQIIQAVQSGSIFNFALWPTGKSTYVYVQQAGGSVIQYQIAGGGLSSTPVSTSDPTGAGSPFVGMAISANGSTQGTGILWETTGNRSDPNLPSTLHALDAGNVSHELWNSDMTGSDSVGMFAKYANPTVVNGKVFVPTWSGWLTVYGLRKDSRPEHPTVRH
jgi:hypothetical protein